MKDAKAAMDVVAAVAARDVANVGSARSGVNAVSVASVVSGKAAHRARGARPGKEEKGARTASRANRGAKAVTVEANARRVAMGRLRTARVHAANAREIATAAAQRLVRRGHRARVPRRPLAQPQRVPTTS